MEPTRIAHCTRRALGAALAAAVATLALSGPADAARAADESPAEALRFAATFDGRSQLSRPCPDGAYLCTEATLAGFGPADYRLFRLTGEPSAHGCVLATVMTVFTLGDGSVLMLAESRTVCGPGQSLGAGGEYEYGNPTRVAGTWTVQEATGQFTGLSGNGTSTTRLAGARFTGSYAGTLLPTSR